MMTMVRVLPEKEYDAILARKKAMSTPAQEEHHHKA
jgi:heme/copper-type cytochrome/quinol oxidase subunit 2